MRLLSRGGALLKGGALSRRGLFSALGTGGGLLLLDKQAYSANGYTAYASPWSTNPGGANAGLSTPADYQDTIRVFADAFPKNSVISWRWPTPGPGSVAGYMHIARGNYDGSAPGGFTPWQVGNITSFTETVDLNTVGTAADFVVLNEFYLTGASGADADKKFEIGHWLHAAGSAVTFFNSQTTIGQHVDPQGRTWDVKNCGLNPQGCPYIVFLLTSRADMLSGVIDKRAALNYLVAQGVIGNYLWVNGTAVGVEPYRGSGTMTVKDYAVAFAGAGSVIPTPPPNLLTNGDFSGADTGWSGFWYSGKTASGGKANFAATPAYDGIGQPVPFVAGKYYEVTFTMATTAGSVFARFTGGTNRSGAERAINGTTPPQRLLANAGNNAFEVTPRDNGFTGTIDDVIVTGPYNTATVGGA